MNRIMGSAAALLIALGLGAGCKSDEGKPAAGKAEGTPQETKPSEQPGAAKQPGTEAPGTPVAGADAGAATAPAAERIKGPVATVNGKPIDSEGYYAELDKVTRHGATIPADRLKRIEENILKRLIEAELISQAVQQEGVQVTDAEVDESFTEYKQRFKSDEQFQNYLKHGKITEQSIKDRIREKKALEKLIEKKGNLAVTEEEGRDFYEKNQRFYREKEGVKASHILIKLPQNAPKEEEDQALAKIEEAKKSIAAGEDFNEIAKRYSEGPSADKGGDLGFFSRGQMVKPFEDVAFAMKVGDVSEPVRTRFGYHIIKVFDRREDKQKTFEEVRSQIEESLKNKKFFQERRRLLEDLRKSAKIEKFVG